MKDTVFDAVRKTAISGAKTATERMKAMVGVPNDPEVNLYRQLEPEDFKEIMRQFGPEATLEYIRKMETKSLSSK